MAFHLCSGIKHFDAYSTRKSTQSIRAPAKKCITTHKADERASKRAGKLTIELSELKKKKKTNERVNGLKVNAVTSFIDARKTTKKKERKKESMPCVD